MRGMGLSCIGIPPYWIAGPATM